MALFNFGKNKGNSCCCCGGSYDEEILQPTAEKNPGSSSSIKVLGAGCGSCHEQHALTAHREM